SGVALKVEIDIALRLAALDAELAREAEGRHPVDQAEIDRLRRAALIGRDVAERHAEDLRRGRAMDILARAAPREQAFIDGQVRHDLELDRRVVRGYEPVAGRLDEVFPNLAALGCTDRYVLQIRVRGRQPPG